ncbi:MAG: methyltransferase domain-containing protein [Candidatus Magasanikbacteria bacterium]|nr:methyltransferase domain-containing protein [Candidatus Magasanikbacteria bacterium]
MILGNLNLSTIGDRLRRLDRFLIRILKARLAQGGLSDLVAEVKRKTSTNGIFPKKRLEIENQRIDQFKKWAEESGIDYNFAAALMYQIMSESCRVQDEYMVKKINDKAVINDETDPEKIFQIQTEDLLALTARVAEKYDHSYGKEFFATKILTNFERGKIFELAHELNHNDLMIDLGCATGNMSLLLAPHFKNVIGFDISHDMIKIANRKVKDNNNISFLQKDLEKGLALKNNSVSLFVMNMGTASEIRNFSKLIEKIWQSLKPGGKIFLSFYNSESLLLKLGFLPWPPQLAAFIDKEKKCLEVNFQDQIYNLYARTRSAPEIKKILQKFSDVSIFSFPTISSVIPAIVLCNEDQSGKISQNQNAQTMLQQIDETLSSSTDYPGTYLIVTATK